MSSGKRADHWIAKATEQRGKLHAKLGVPEGERIPLKKLFAAGHRAKAKGEGKLAKEVALAKTLRSMHHR